MFCVLCFVFLFGCATHRVPVKPLFQGEAIEQGESVQTKRIVIINDKKTKIGFQEAMESWLQVYDYEYVVTPEGSRHELPSLTLEYVGYWNWDLGLFMREARINAHHEGQKIGEVEYRAPNNLNMNKFGDASKRIKYMMDILFGKLSVSEANKLINPSEKE
ncbi:MAG: hypothetical protein GY699_08270 [Desulfobacteraceae bacterium]|nr:hypothetical protein [Desulfobacteraceae bacterium]